MGKSSGRKTVVSKEEPYIVSGNVPLAMQVGPPTLRVRDLGKELLFYEGQLGLRVLRRFNDETETGNLELIELGFKEYPSRESKLPLLTLKHDPDARDAPQDSAGLFHFAILVPDRKSLASTFVALEKSKTPFDGFADHLVSESLYLHDPELNGIEIYRDRPQKDWLHDAKGHVIMDTLPLDLQSVVKELTDHERRSATTFPSLARIGHMHLRVTDLQRSLAFYQENLGLKLTADWSARGADFLAFGDYHHHLGINTWQSLDGKSHLDGESGLEQIALVLPDRSQLGVLATSLGESVLERNQDEIMLTDPDGIRIVIKTSG
jgi:catechol 2,3-dioxygenase